MSYWNSDSFGKLVDCVIVKVTEVNNDSVEFELQDGRKAVLYHQQDCCESVYLEATIGNVDDIMNSPVLRVSEEDYDGGPESEYEESYMWSCFRVGTAKGSVLFRFYGSSNGYYSEDVSFRFA